MRKSHTLKLDVEKILKLREEKLTYAVIAKRLGCSPASVGQALRAHKLKGVKNE